MLDEIKKISHDSGWMPNLSKLVESSGNVTLPDDFWDEFYSEVGNTGDIRDNHELLKQLT